MSPTWAKSPRHANSPSSVERVAVELTAKTAERENGNRVGRGGGVGSTWVSGTPSGYRGFTELGP